MIFTNTIYSKNSALFHLHQVVIYHGFDFQMIASRLCKLMQAN